MKKLAILQNADFEKSGRLGAWAHSLGFGVEEFCAYKGELPATEYFSHLVVLGTPHSVHEIPQREWLNKESTLVARALDQGKHVLGICFGAQLLAHLLGGSVSLGAEAEIGWHRMPAQPHPAQWNAPGMAEGELFFWHREIFSLPPGCQPLGSTPAGYLGGFSYGKKVLALSGHLEITEELIEEYIQLCWSDRNAGPYVQPPEHMRARCSEVAAAREAFARGLFTAWANG